MPDSMTNVIMILTTHPYTGAPTMVMRNNEWPNTCGTITTLLIGETHSETITTLLIGETHSETITTLLIGEMHSETITTLLIGDAQ